MIQHTYAMAVRVAMADGNQFWHRAHAHEHMRHVLHLSHCALPPQAMVQEDGQPMFMLLDRAAQA